MRASILTEEGAPPKLNIQEMVKLDEARVDLPSLISIRVWLKDEAAVSKADALNELFVRKHGVDRGPPPSRKTPRFFSRDGRQKQGAARPRIPRRTGKNLRT